MAFNLFPMIGKPIDAAGVVPKREKIFWKAVPVTLGIIINKLAYLNKAFRINFKE